MKDNFKYRAWIEPGKMQYGIVPFKWDFCIDTMFSLCIKSTGNGILGSGGDTAKWELGGYAYFQRDEKHLMVHFGYSDKNKTEVYTGDFIIIKNDFDESYIAEVVFANGMFGAIWEDASDNHFELLETFAEFEVIGNKYENPQV